MSLARLPITGSDANTWSDILNRNITQTNSALNGAFKSFDQFSARPTNLTVDDVGRTYLYTQTGNWHEWSGTEWKVQNKSEINVKDYGAVGDGVADDSTAFFKALQLIGSGGTVVNLGGSVFIPKGKYRITQTIKLDGIAGVKIFGESQGASYDSNGSQVFGSVLINDTNQDLIRVDKTVGPVVTMAISIKNIAIEQNNNTNTIGINVVNVWSRLFISNISILGGKYGIKIGRSNGDNNFPFDVYIEKYNASSTSPNRMTSALCIGRSGSVFCKDFWINGCDKGVEHIYETIGDTLQNLTLENVIIEGSQKEAMDLKCVNKLKIDNCHFESCCIEDTTLYFALKLGNFSNDSSGYNTGSHKISSCLFAAISKCILIDDNFGSTEIDNLWSTGYNDTTLKIISSRVSGFSGVNLTNSMIGGKIDIAEYNGTLIQSNNTSLSQELQNDSQKTAVAFYNSQKFSPFQFRVKDGMRLNVVADKEEFGLSVGTSDNGFDQYRVLTVNTSNTSVNRGLTLSSAYFNNDLRLFSIGGGKGCAIQSKDNVGTGLAFLNLNPSGGNVGIGTEIPTSKLHVTGIIEYSDNAAAVTAGLTPGAFYRTGEILKIVF